MAAATASASGCDGGVGRGAAAPAALALLLLLLFFAGEELRPALLAPELLLAQRVRGAGGGARGPCPAPAGDEPGSGVLAGAGACAFADAARGGGGGGGGAPPRRLDLRVMILSQAASGRKRAAVRRASLPTVPAATYRVGYLFLLTRPPDVEARSLLAAENATFGDLHFADDTVRSNHAAEHHGYWFATGTRPWFTGF